MAISTCSADYLFISIIGDTPVAGKRRWRIITIENAEGEANVTYRVTLLHLETFYRSTLRFIESHMQRGRCRFAQAPTSAAFIQDPLCQFSTLSRKKPGLMVKIQQTTKKKIHLISLSFYSKLQLCTSQGAFKPFRPSPGSSLFSPRTFSRTRILLSNPKLY